MTVLALTACGGDSFKDNCEDSCTNAAKCDGSTTDPSTCKASCANEIALDNDSDCTDKANDYADCASGIDACDTAAIESKCGNESAAYRKCTTDYCIEHDSDTHCTTTTG